MPGKEQNVEGAAIKRMSIQRDCYTNCMSAFLRNVEQNVLYLLLEFKDTEVKRTILG